MRDDNPLAAAIKVAHNLTRIVTIHPRDGCHAPQVTSAGHIADVVPAQRAVLAFQPYPIEP